MHVDPSERPGRREAIALWAKIGCLSFGGPAAQIALMHREIVDRRRWLDERGFLDALSFCMVLPGPEAMQLATYAGWRLHGWAGGLMAGLLFVLPGAAVILALAWIYLVAGTVPLVAALFLGIKAAVLVIVAEALVKVARRALLRPAHWAIAAAAFVALFAFATPYPFVILAAALLGAVMAGPGDDTPAPAPVPLARTVRTAAIGLGVWLVPVAALSVAMPDHILSEIARFFSVLATVTFGGAYAVLAYMAQEAVTGRGWLTAAEMADALGLAETTPGPLILVTEFVAILAAAREGGFAMSLAGAGVALWATFAPCFLWVFTGAPYIERLRTLPRLQSAFAAITAAVVGVILNLSLWFALQVVFSGAERTDGPVPVWVPDLAGFDPRVALLSLAAAVALFVLRLGVLGTLAVAAGLSLLVTWAG